MADSIDRNSPRHVYQQAADILLNRIRTGVYAPGQEIPSMFNLGRELDISELTMDRAFKQLRDQGWLVIRHGYPTRIASQLPKDTSPDPLLAQAQRVRNSWQNPDAAWWAKAARARKHIDDVSAMLATFDPPTAYEVVPEPTDQPRVTALRLRVLRPFPVEMLTTIGDALHNMRSCLDSIAYELARRHLGDSMTSDQKSASKFPICETRARFDDFLSKHGRMDMYGQAERDALRCAQPFALSEEAVAAGVNFTTSPQEEYRINQLVRLSRLNNLDKHRYLPLLAWYPDIAYPSETWPSFGLDLRWHTPLKDEALIGHLTFEDVVLSDPIQSLIVQMGLAFADDPGYAGDFLGALRNWHGYLTGWIVPRIFIVADGNPPPIMIGG